MFLPHPRVKVSIAGSLRDQEVACSASDRQGSNFESCVWRTVSSQSSHHPQEFLLAQFSLYVHKGGLKPASFHFLAVLCASVWFRAIGPLRAGDTQHDQSSANVRTTNTKFELWRSEAEHATSRSRRLPTILTFTRGWGRNIFFVSCKPPRTTNTIPAY